jgi:hypothetical protein
LIGRVIKFVEIPNDVLHAKIGWFHRSFDVADSNAQDSKLLVASMHSDVNPYEPIPLHSSVTKSN